MKHSIRTVTWITALTLALIFVSLVIAESRLIPPIGITEGAADVRYPQLDAANTFTKANTFGADVTLGDTAADTFTLNAVSNDVWKVVDVIHFTTAASRTITLPADSMGINGALRIDVLARNTSGSSQDLEIDFGATQLHSIAMANNAIINIRFIHVWNEGAADNQRAAPTNMPGHGASTNVMVNPTEDTTSAVTITFDSATTGNLAIEYATVEVLNKS